MNKGKFIFSPEKRLSQTKGRGACAFQVSVLSDLSGRTRNTTHSKMKLSRILLWSVAAACLPAAKAEPWNQYPGNGPETTLDSLWAATGHMQTFSDAIYSQLGAYRFQAGGNSRLWFNAMGSMGDARVRNNHPSFDYSAGGGAFGYDYCRSEDGEGGMLGLALGYLSGTQNIDEMADHPDGFIEGDKFRQNTMMVDVYGALCRKTGPKSNLLLAMNVGFGTTDNKCSHHGLGYEASKWDTETWNISLSAEWRYQATKSFAVIPFARVSYLHASNKVEKDDYDDDDSWWWDDVEEEWVQDSHSRWENRGSMNNVALELGLTLEHVIRFSNGKTWTNALSGSYCPDIYRSNPRHTFNDTWWEGDAMYESSYRGSGYTPSRKAFKAKFMSRLMCSERLSVYASWQTCFREDYLEHQAAVGVAVSF